ncbi:hypothetical protein BKA70DRAFT_113937 [Coprinopsis sp. MPI-PUGE-AT-0042]|nr:hypothetical protein BKA70DRAFT_113937 [Coprinopsis sp. MPI-PUGE-AT-0042]
MFWLHFWLSAFVIRTTLPHFIHLSIFHPQSLHICHFLPSSVFRLFPTRLYWLSRSSPSSASFATFIVFSGLLAPNLYPLQTNCTHVDHGFQQRHLHGLQIMIPDEGPNSSEDGSGLHSPVFAGSQSAYSSHHPAGGPGGGGHGESNFRYADHLDVHHGYDAPHHHPHQAHPHQQHTQQQHHNPYPPPPPQHHSQQQHQQQQQHTTSQPHTMRTKISSTNSSSITNNNI